MMRKSFEDSDVNDSSQNMSIMNETYLENTTLSIPDYESNTHQGLDEKVRKGIINMINNRNVEPEYSSVDYESVFGDRFKIYREVPESTIHGDNYEGFMGFAKILRNRSQVISNHKLQYESFTGVESNKGSKIFTKDTLNNSSESCDPEINLKVWFFGDGNEQTDVGTHKYQQRRRINSYHSESKKYANSPCKSFVQTDKIRCNSDPTSSCLLNEMDLQTDNKIKITEQILPLPTFPTDKSKRRTQMSFVKSQHPLFKRNTSNDHEPFNENIKNEKLKQIKIRTSCIIQLIEDELKIPDDHPTFDITTVSNTATGCRSHVGSIVEDFSVCSISQCSSNSNLSSDSVCLSDKKVKNWLKNKKYQLPTEWEKQNVVNVSYEETAFDFVKSALK